MALTSDQQSAIESAYSSGDYGTVSNLLGAAGVTASQADSIWGSGISDTASRLGVNFAPTTPDTGGLPTTTADQSTAGGLPQTSESATGWTAPALQDVYQYGRGSWYNPNTGQIYAGKAAAEAANKDLVTQSLKPALADAWTTAETTGDYAPVKDILGQSGVSGFDVTNMYGLTPEQQQKVTAKTGFDFVAPKITYYTGEQFDTKTLMNLANQLSQNLDPSQLSGGVYGETRANIGFDPNEFERATGTKANPVSQVLLDAAVGLARQGVTDLSQLKQGDIKGDVSVREIRTEEGLPTGQYAAYWGDNEGGTQSRILTPEEAARITRTQVAGDSENPGYEQMLLKDAVIGKGLMYGDKKISDDASNLYLNRTYTGPGNTSYYLSYDANGKPTFRTVGGSSSDAGIISAALTMGSFIPGVAPFALAANAAIQLDQGNTLGALASLAGAGGFTDAATAFNAANAAKSGNANALIGTLLANPSINTAAQNTMLTDTISFADVGHASNLATNLANNNLGGALTAAGALTNSPDTKIAGAATTIATELKKDNPNLSVVMNAAKAIDNATAGAKVDDKTVKALTDKVVKTETPTDTTKATDTEFGNLQGAINDATARNTVVLRNDEANSLEEAMALAKARNPNATQFTIGGNTYTMGATNASVNAAATQNNIANATTFSEAFDAARSAYGPGKTFEWNGKTYSTDTRAENPTLATASDTARLNNIGASSTAGAGRGSAASYANYDAAAAALGAANVNPNKGATQAEIDSYFGDGTAQYDPMGNVTMGSLGLADDKTALGRLVINSNKAVGTAVQTGLSNLAQAGGEQLASLGGAAATVGLAGADNAAVKAGQSAENFGKSIETEASKQGTQNIYSAIKNAEGIGGKIIAGLKAGFENPGAAVNLITREALQEVMPVGAAAATSKMMGLFAAAGVDTALNAAESMGGSYNEVYQAAIKAGASKEDADAAATRVGLAAGAITAVTSGIADAAVVKSLMREANSSVGSAAAKATLKEGVSENVEETATALATQYLTTGKIDWNAATTQGVIGQLVGGKTSGAITAGEGVSDSLSNVPVTNIESVSKSVTSDIAAGKDVGSTIDSSISTAIKGGENGPSVVSSAVSSAIAGGADVTATVDNAIGSAITNKVDAGAAINTAVGAAINSGADATTSITAAINSAANSGVDIHTSIDSSVAAAVKAGVDTQTAINAAVNAATNAGVDTNVATNIATNAATNTNVNTNANTNVNTNTNANTNENVNTNANTNTNTNVNTNVNTNTDTGLTGGTDGTTTTTTTPTTTPTKTTTTKGAKLPAAGGMPLSGSGDFLKPEPFRFHQIAKDSKFLNPTLFALAGIDPLKGTLEEKIAEKEKKMPTQAPSLMDLMFAPPTQQNTAMQPVPVASDSGTNAAAEPEAPAPVNPPDEIVPAYAHGGLTGLHPMGQPQFYSQGGLGNMHVQGDGDGTSDSVPAMVAKDEFVLPADVVSSLGNGSSEAGASVLDHFVEIIRKHKQSNPPSELPPQSKGPLEYLSSAMKKGHA